MLMISVIRRMKPIYNDSFNFMEMMLLVTLHGPLSHYTTIGHRPGQSWSFRHCERVIIAFTSWDNAGCLQNKCCPTKLLDDVEVIGDIYPWYMNLNRKCCLLILYSDCKEKCENQLQNNKKERREKIVEMIHVNSDSSMENQCAQQ